MLFKLHPTRPLALLLGFVLASTTFRLAPVQAADKSKKLKYGAIAAGVVGAYLFSKGKTVPAAAVAAGGYYAYKKSQNARQQERYGSNRDDNRYGYNPDRNVYSDDVSTQYRSSAAVRARKQTPQYDLSPYLR